MPQGCAHCLEKGRRGYLFCADEAEDQQAASLSTGQQPVEKVHPGC